MKDLYTQPDGEYPRTTTIDGDIVTCHHVTKHDTGNVYLKWGIDFEDVTHDQLLELATRSVKIGLRPEFKKVPASEIPDWNERTFKVTEYLARERKAVATPAKVKSLFAGLSDEDKADLLKELKG